MVQSNSNAIFFHEYNVSNVCIFIDFIDVGSFFFVLDSLLKLEIYDFTNYVVE